MRGLRLYCFVAEPKYSEGYKKWKELVVNVLARAGVKIVLFTNSILFTPATITYLVDRNVLLRVNVSIDGAKKETVESIRVNVNYKKMVKLLKQIKERLI